MSETVPNPDQAGASSVAAGGGAAIEAGGGAAKAVRTSGTTSTDLLGVTTSGEGGGPSAGGEVVGGSVGGDPAGASANLQSGGTAMESPSVSSKDPLGPGPFGFDDFDTGVTLGTGSFGRVRIATHNTTQTPWAIKILKKAEIVRMQQVLLCTEYLSSKKLLAY